MDILNTISLESNSCFKMNFNGGNLSSDAGLLMGNPKVHTDELTVAERNYREAEDLSGQSRYDFGLAL